MAALEGSHMHAENGLFSAPVEEHARMRRRVAAGFTPGAIQRIEKQIRDVGRRAGPDNFWPRYCLGANLARSEVRCILDAALDFLPRGPRFVEDEIGWMRIGMFSRIEKLPVDFGR